MVVSTAIYFSVDMWRSVLANQGLIGQSSAKLDGLPRPIPRLLGMRPFAYAGKIIYHYALFTRSWKGYRTGVLDP